MQEDTTIKCEVETDEEIEEASQSITQKVATARTISPQSKRRKIPKTITPTKATAKAHLKNFNISVAAQMKSKLQQNNMQQQKSSGKMELKALARLQPKHGNHTAAEEIDATSLIDSEQVTTFIFKGEEYVQMPKEYYIQEKIELMQKMRTYESVLLGLKQRLNNVNLP